jgi:hypothetical protein
MPYKNKEEALDRSARYYAANREEILWKHRVRYAANQQRERKRSAAYRAARNAHAQSDNFITTLRSIREIGDALKKIAQNNHR